MTDYAKLDEAKKILSLVRTFGADKDIASVQNFITQYRTNPQRYEYAAGMLNFIKDTYGKDYNRYDLTAIPNFRAQYDYYLKRTGAGLEPIVIKDPNWIPSDDDRENKVMAKWYKSKKHLPQPYEAAEWETFYKQNYWDEDYSNTVEDQENRRLGLPPLKIQTNQKVAEQYEGFLNEFNAGLRAGTIKTTADLDKLWEKYDYLSGLTKRAREYAEKAEYDEATKPSMISDWSKFEGTRKPSPSNIDVEYLKEAFGYDEKTGFQSLYDEANTLLVIKQREDSYARAVEAGQRPAQNFSEKTDPEIQKILESATKSGDVNEVAEAMRRLSTITPESVQAGKVALDEPTYKSIIGVQGQYKAIKDTADATVKIAMQKAEEGDEEGAKRILTDPNSVNILTIAGYKPDELAARAEAIAEKLRDPKAPIEWSEKTTESGASVLVSDGIISKSKQVGITGKVEYGGVDADVNSPGRFVISPTGDGRYVLAYTYHQSAVHVDNGRPVQVWNPDKGIYEPWGKDEYPFSQIFRDLESAKKAAAVYREQIMNGQDIQDVAKEQGFLASGRAVDDGDIGYMTDADLEDKELVYDAYRKIQGSLDKATPKTGKSIIEAIVGIFSPGWTLESITEEQIANRPYEEIKQEVIKCRDTNRRVSEGWYGKFEASLDEWFPSLRKELSAVLAGVWNAATIGAGETELSEEMAASSELGMIGELGGSLLPIVRLEKSVGQILESKAPKMKPYVQQGIKGGAAVGVYGLARDIQSGKPADEIAYNFLLNVGTGAFGDMALARLRAETGGLLPEYGTKKYYQMKASGQLDAILKPIKERIARQIDAELRANLEAARWIPSKADFYMPSSTSELYARLPAGGKTTTHTTITGKKIFRPLWKVAGDEDIFVVARRTDLSDYQYSVLSDMVDAPPRYINDIKAAFRDTLDNLEKRIDDETKSLEDYIRKYKGKPAERIPNVERPGYQDKFVSTNEPWYREFRQKMGRAPRASEVPELAKNLIRDSRYAGELFPPEMPELIRLYDELKPLYDELFDGDIVRISRTADDGFQVVYGTSRTVPRQVDAVGTVPEVKRRIRGARAAEAQPAQGKEVFPTRGWGEPSFAQTQEQPRIGRASRQPEATQERVQAPTIARSETIPITRPAAQEQPRIGRAAREATETRQSMLRIDEQVSPDENVPAMLRRGAEYPEPHAQPQNQAKRTWRAPESSAPLDVEDANVPLMLRRGTEARASLSKTTEKAFEQRKGRVGGDIIEFVDPNGARTIGIEAKGIKWSEGYTEAEAAGKSGPQSRFGDRQSKFNNYVEGKNITISEFFKKWLRGRGKEGPLEKLYIRKITPEGKEKLEALLGRQIKAKDFIITNNDIIHIIDEHGNPSVEARRGQIAVDADNIKAIPELLDSPDYVYLGDIDRFGRDGIIFQKDLGNGRAIYAQFENTGKGEIQGKTYLIKKGKGGSPVSNAETGLYQTSETSGRISPSVDDIVTKLEKGSQALSDDALGIVSPVVDSTVSGLTKIGRRFYQNFVSGTAPLERAAKVQGKRYAVSFNDRIRAVRDAGGRVDFILKDGLTNKAGDVIGPSWDEVMKKIPEADRALYNEYRQNLHNIARQAEKKPVLAKTAEESRKIVDDILKKHPEFKKFDAEINEFNDKFMREYVVGGLISEEQYRIMREKYPDYIPTLRMEYLELRRGGGGSNAISGNRIAAKGIYRAKGATSEVVPLEDAFPLNVNRLLRASLKNDLYYSMLEWAAEYPEEAATFVRLKNVDPEADIFRNGVNGAKLEDIIDKADLAPVKEISKGLYEITAYKNGKPIQGYISKEVYDAIMHLNGKSIPEWMLKGMEMADKFFMNPFKAFTTGYSAKFWVRNVMRDLPTAYAYSLESNPIKYAAYHAKAIQEMKTNGKHWQTYRALGGNRSGFYSVEKGFTASAKSAMPRKIKGAIEGVGKTLEAEPRFTEYLIAIDKFGDTPAGRMKAMSAAADVTVDFSRNAPLSKFLNSFVAYFNAGVQGLDRFCRSLKGESAVRALTIKAPATALRTAAKLASTGTTLAVALHLWNKGNPHYRELSNYERDNYYCFPNIADCDEYGYPKTFIKIPISRENGVFYKALIERIIDTIYGDPEPFKGFEETIMNNFLPPNPVTENVFATPYLNLKYNRDYAGRPIVPESMEDLEEWAQYDERTSEVAKAIGKMMNWSPKKIDYVIQYYTGDVGDIITTATAGSTQDVADFIYKTLIEPWYRSFTADPVYSNQIVIDFYDKLREATVNAATRTKVENIPSEASTPEDRLRSMMQKASDKISELKKQERAILGQNDITQAEKDKQIRALREQAIQIAKDALAEYEKGSPSTRIYPPGVDESKRDEYDKIIEAGVPEAKLQKVFARFAELTPRPGNKTVTVADRRNALYKMYKAGELTRKEWETIVRIYYPSD